MISGLAPALPRVVSSLSLGGLPVEITDNDRHDIVRRLRAIQQAFDQTDEQMASVCGVSRQAWGNYISIKNFRMIGYKQITALKREFGVTSDFIQMGDMAEIADPELRRKLGHAMHSPRRRKRGRRPHR